MAATPATRTAEPDAIIVGAGLAGLVAAAELVDAGKRVVIVEQEPEASLGGQAHWSFGGLFLIDSPEQRRMGIKDSLELAQQDWFGTAGFDRDEDEWGRALGRGLPRVRRRREARVAAREGRAVLPDRRLGGARRLHRHRPRQLGAALPHHVGHRAGRARPVHRARAGRRGARAWSSSGTATASTSSIVESGAVVGVRGAVLAADAAGRGEPSNREVVGDFELRAPAVVVASGGIGGNHDLVRRVLARAPGRRARGDALGRARPRRRTHAADRRARGRAPHQRRSHVALHRGHHELGSGLAEARHPHPARPVVAVVRRRRAGASPCRSSRASTRSARSSTCVSTGHDHSWFVLTQKIIEKEFALSGSEQNPDLTGKDLKLLADAARLGRARPGRGVQAARASTSSSPTPSTS